MPVSSVERKHGSIVERILGWWQNWTSTSSSPELACCAEGEVTRIASDMGMSASELRALARQGPDAAGLLPQRMAVLGLDPNVVAQAEPGTLQDLQRICSICESKRQCARDLAHTPNDPDWEDYCPNVATLKMLDAMRLASRRA